MSKKYPFSVSLLISLLIILIPVAMATELNSYDKVQTKEQRIDLYQSREPFERDYLSDPGRACVEQNEELDDLAALLSKDTEVLEQIAIALFTLCTTMSAVDTIISSVAMAIGMFSGDQCCTPAMMTCPGPCGAPCTAMSGIYKSWSSIYSFVRPLCCFVNCGWCMGAKTGDSCWGLPFGLEKLAPAQYIPDMDISSGLNFQGKEKGGIGQFGLSPFDNIYLAGACLCPVAIIFNLRKLKTIYDVYDCCIQEACENGLSTDSCERQLDEATCMYYEGSLYKMGAKVLTSLIISLITKVLFENLVKDNFMEGVIMCGYAVFKLTQIPKVIEGVTSAWDYMSRSFDEPMCEDLGFDDVKDQAKEEWIEYTMVDKDGDGIYDGVYEDPDTMVVEIPEVLPLEGERLQPIETVYSHGLATHHVDFDPETETLTAYFADNAEDEAANDAYRYWFQNENNGDWDAFREDIDITLDDVADDDGFSAEELQIIEDENLEESLRFTTTDPKYGDYPLADMETLSSMEDLVGTSVTVQTQEGDLVYRKVVKAAPYFKDGRGVQLVDENLDVFYTSPEGSLTDSPLEHFGEKEEKTVPEPDSFHYALMSHTDLWVYDATTEKPEDWLRFHPDAPGEPVYDIDGSRVYFNEYGEVVGVESVKNGEFYISTNPINHELWIDIEGEETEGWMISDTEEAIRDNEGNLLYYNEDGEILGRLKEGEGHQKLIKSKRAEYESKTFKLSDLNLDSLTKKGLKQDYADSQVKIAMYDMTWELFDMTLGEEVDDWVEKQCKEEYKVSYPAQNTPTEIRGSAECENTDNNIYNGQIISRTGLGSSCRYSIAYTLAACNHEIDYVVQLQDTGPNINIEGGVLGLGQTVSKNKIVTANTCAYERICIIIREENSTACFPPISAGGGSV